MFLEFFIITTITMLAYGLFSRTRRGADLKSQPRNFEKLGLWRIGGKVFHVHHGYLGIVLTVVFYIIYNPILLGIGVGLVISDIIFHIIAHIRWGDALWD